MRLASSAGEQLALGQRLRAAEISATARGCLDALTNFGAAVLNSRVVLARSLGDVESWVKSENRLYVSFHKQVRAGARLPEENKWDQGRVAAEATILPNFYDDVSFAALSLDGRGVEAYGSYFVVLREPIVAHRTSVFEENPFVFCQRHRLVAGNAAPPGYRAVWTERDRLAKAKLGSKITGATVPTEYAAVLLTQGKGTGDADFIEAHVFGPIHRSAIEKVIGPRPKRGPDLVIWRSLDRALAQIGAALEPT